MLRHMFVPSGFGSPDAVAVSLTNQRSLVARAGAARRPAARVVRARPDPRGRPQPPGRRDPFRGDGGRRARTRPSSWPPARSAPSSTTSSEDGRRDDRVPRHSRPRPAATPAGQRPGRRRTRRPVALALALVFFFGPLGASRPGRATARDSRTVALTDFPSLSDGWSFFPQFTTWATDHLPLRGEAVEANAALSEARLR